MAGGSGSEVEKRDTGARIRQLRREAGLKQWQLAEMIGATQPAIHMYERGVLPEPRRLLQLARIGGTTVEWILTGRHWENGSEKMERLEPEVCELACELRRLDGEAIGNLRSALGILRSASDALERPQARRPSVSVITRTLEESSGSTMRALASALTIHDAVCRRITDEVVERHRRSGLMLTQSSRSKRTRRRARRAR